MTKIQQCCNIVRHNLEMTLPQIIQVAKDIPCNKATVYRAIERVKAENAKKMLQLRPNKNHQITNPKSKQKLKDKLFGKKNSKKTNIPVIPASMNFEHFTKYHSFPHYDGLYRWQIAMDKEIWPWEISSIKGPRDHGKSIYLGNKCQWCMSGQNYDVIYLGWTSRRKQVADFIYNFFLQRKELVIDKTSSNYHFKTNYGTKFDTYSVKSKEILGMHDIGTMNRQIIDENRYLEDFIRNDDRPLLMIIDDPIDGTFRKERHKEKDLEDFYQSTILNINPDKLMIAGTHKFDGDFLHFVEKVHEDDIIVYKRTPFLDKNDPRYNMESDNPSNLLCPERWIDELHPKYALYLKLKKAIKKGLVVTTLTPEEQALIKKKDLTKKRRQAGEYWWHSEYMQDPHPISGEVWKKLHHTLAFPGTAVFDMVGISIDRATTKNKTSDETGITVTFRESEEYYDEVMETTYHNYLVMADFTQKIDLFDLIPFIDKLYREYMLIYQRTLVIKIIVEKQGGGDDFIALAERKGKRFAHCIIPVHNTRDKETRIKDTLRTPINNAQISFIASLKDSKLEKQIIHFPHSVHDDAIDSLCNGFIEMEKLPAVKYKPDEIVPQLRHHRQQIKQSSQDPSVQQVIAQNRRRSIF